MDNTTFKVLHVYVYKTYRPKWYNELHVSAVLHYQKPRANTKILQHYQGNQNDQTADTNYDRAVVYLLWATIIHKALYRLITCTNKCYDSKYHIGKFNGVILAGVFQDEPRFEVQGDIVN